MIDKLWTWEIKTERQSNGGWGTSHNCVYIDQVVFGIDFTLNSALCMGIAEAYPNETFAITLSTEKWFLVKLSSTGYKMIRYDDYRLEGNVLTYIGNNNY